MNQTQNKLGKISIECMMNSSNNNGLDTMKVTSLELKDVGGIPHLKLENINPQMNIICGENGVGKTNILDSIAYMFSKTNNNILSMRKNGVAGYIQLATNPPSILFEFIEEKLNEYGPKHNLLKNQIIGVKESELNHLLYLKVNRIFSYKKEQSVGVDKDHIQASRLNISGINNEDLKTWLIVRQGFAKQNLSYTQQKNVELAARCFSILNPEYSFSNVGTDFEVYVNTPNGEIHFEYLSSGFKSTLYILLGIIKELDLRFKDVSPASDFDGIVLIDEIELHLHPEWQGKICNILKDIFPKAQFFISTHSPHVVQIAGKDEVIALERKGDEVNKRDLPTSEYGYQGWTIEEILKDVMGMKGTRSEEYNEIKDKFLNAFRKKDKPNAQEAFDKLQEMLHPSNELKVIFQMQLDSLGE